MSNRNAEKDKRVTMKDIARAVGVSTNTVSRALNNKPDIRPETVERIRVVAERMGYAGAKTIKGLRAKGTKIVGLIIADNTNPFFSSVVKGTEDALSHAGYNLILCNTNENYAKEKSIIEMLVQKRVDGILVTPSQSKEEDISRLVQKGLPLVLVGRHFTDLEVGTVLCDDKAGAMAAVEHLIRLGHRDVLFINAPGYISSAVERQAGFEEAFEKNGLQPNPALVRVCDPKVESAYNTIRSVLIEGIKFTAVFTFSDLMMLGVIKAFREAGVRIPRDVSAVGFDDIEFVSLLSPSLTTVRQQRYQMGFESARLLLSKIHGDKENHRVVLPTELIVRESTAKIG